MSIGSDQLCLQALQALVGAVNKIQQTLATSPLVAGAIPGVYTGAGDPNAVITAPQGSLFLRTDGSSSSTRGYINTDGVTAWTNITTAA